MATPEWSLTPEDYATILAFWDLVVPGWQDSSNLLLGLAESRVALRALDMLAQMPQENGEVYDGAP